MHPVESLIIIGGGTAGWIAASLLKARFGSSLSITLIESDRVGTIGVGEASLPIMRDFLRALKIDESELMRECEASLKAGLRFAQPFNLKLLGAVKPEVAPAMLTRPGPAGRLSADKDNPWAEGWGRQSVDELREDLEGFLKR